MGEPFTPLDDSPWEEEVARLVRQGWQNAHTEPYATALTEALTATAAVRDVLAAFGADYRSDDDTALPLLWLRR